MGAKRVQLPLGHALGQTQNISLLVWERLRIPQDEPEDAAGEPVSLPLPDLGLDK